MAVELVIQKIFEFCPEEDYRFILEELVDRILELSQDQYGNYVIQFIIDRQGGHLMSTIWSDLKGKVFELSIHKYASNVIEKLLTYGSQEIKRDIIKEIINKDDQFR